MMSNTVSYGKRDHGGGLDAAVRHFGGTRSDWIDLSTGINPVAYPLLDIPHNNWTDLPDISAQAQLIDAARSFWQVPKDAAVLAAPGASALIAGMPALAQTGEVFIPQPTYNEHAAAFANAGWTIANKPVRTAQVLVHPNNPTGVYWTKDDLRAELNVIDESFCDIAPDRSLMSCVTRNDTVILKSFGKFWGLAGLRLGFAIGHTDLIVPLAEKLGPWPVSGPALCVGEKALTDKAWAARTRTRLDEDSARLDAMMTRAGASVIGGTSLFRLYKVDDAVQWQNRLASHKIWSRTFPYASEWLRLGLPHPDYWDRLQAALV